MLPKQVFVNAMQEVLPHVSHKAVLPILTYVHLKASAGEVIIEASNLEDYICCKFSARIPDMDVLLPTNFVKPMLKASTDIDVRIDNGQLVFVFGVDGSSDNTELKTNIMPGSDFPQPNVDFNTITWHKFDESMAQIMSYIAPYMCNDEIQSHLYGVSFDGKSFAATDTTVLAWYELPNKLGIEKSIIISNKSVKKLFGVDVCDIGVANNFVLFRYGIDGCDDIVVLKSLRLVDATFPNWTAVIPKVFSVVYEVDVRSLYNIIKTFKGAGYSWMMLDIILGNDVLDLVMYDSMKEVEVSASIGVSIKSGQPGAFDKVSFNADKILLGLSTLLKSGADKCDMSFSEDKKPLLLSASSFGAPSVIVMPFVKYE